MWGICWIRSTFLWLHMYNTFFFFRTGKISFASPPSESILDDSFMMYTSSEDDHDIDLGLPPRPPSTRSKDKSFVSASPEMFSPTPSSGHFSGGSAASKSPGETQVQKVFVIVGMLKICLLGVSDCKTEERDWSSEVKIYCSRQKLESRETRIDPRNIKDQVKSTWT